MKTLWRRFVVWLAKTHFPHLVELEKLQASGLTEQVRVKVLEAEETGSLGKDKQVFASVGVRAAYHTRRLTPPPERDINVLIEHIVQGWL